MKQSLPYGIRYTADASFIDRSLDGGYLGSTMDLLEDHFRGTGEDFYFNEVDIDQHQFGGRKCQDVFGWVVPKDQEGQFRKWWLSARRGEDNDRYPYAAITWFRGADGQPAPHVEIYN